MSLPPAVDYRSQGPSRGGGNKTVLIIIVVFVFAIAITVTGGIALFRSATQSTTGATTAANTFLTYIQHDDYSDAYSLLTPDAQGQTKLSTMQDLVGVAEKSHGQLISWGQPSWYVQYYNGISYVQLRYPLSYANEQSQATITMQHMSDNSYKVYNFNFQF